MYLDDTKYKSRTKTWMRIIILTLVVGFILTFRFELLLLLQFLWGLLNFFLGKPLLLHEKTLSSFVVLTFNAVIFLIAFLIMSYIVASQTLVPVSTPLEKRRTTWHLIMHILRMHGPAFFVKEGKLIISEEDKKSTGPGLMAIDYNSAVVLEEQLPNPGVALTDLVSLPKNNAKDKQPAVQKNIAIAELSISDRVMYEMGAFQLFESPRAVGAGITFTRPRERIRGVVDLRKQSRTRNDVRGYTRDGIEISTTIWTLFTIGQVPEILDVSYEGDRHSKNLRVVRLKKQPLKNGSFNIEIEGFLDDLDLPDKQEIHVNAEEILRSQAMNTFSDAPPENMIPLFDAERVFAAVFSEARSEEEKVVPWSELPPNVAVDIFRELLSQYNYDQLYQPHQPANFPAFRLRQHFRTLVRNKGVLACRLVFHKTRRPLVPGIYDPNDLRVSEIFNLRQPKILRERGIKLIACGFTDLIPPDEVYKQRLDNWRAQWEQETRIAQATYELEAMRIRNKARLQAQQELRFEFMKILQASDHPQEVLALRVLEALENAAADPKTKQFLPRETLDLMKNLDHIFNK